VQQEYGRFFKKKKKGGKKKPPARARDPNNNCLSGRAAEGKNGQKKLYDDLFSPRPVDIVT